MLTLSHLSKRINATAGEDLKYMSYSAEAMLQQTPGRSRAMLWLIGLFIVVMLVWAGYAQVDEFTRGDGKIVPSSDIQVVQNLEGGILARLMVEEGQVVQQGQQLLQIDDTLLSSSFREKDLLLAQLSVKSARLKAEADSVSFDAALMALGRNFPARLIASEQDLYLARQQEFKSRLDSYNQKVAQKLKELESARSAMRTLQLSYDIQSREVSMTRPLVKAGAVSQVELLRLERQLNDLKGDLNKAELAIPQLEAEYRETVNNVASYTQSFTNESRQALNDVSAEISRLQESNQAIEDRVSRTIVRSPVKGTVKQIGVKTVGGVIQPGMDLVEIVPIDDSLVVDARVKPSDIAFIHPGQRATVKFTAYDFAIHGGLAAKVTHISPDTIRDQDGLSFYQIRLLTESSHLGKAEKPLPIIPGMTVQIDILTGKKTVLDYLLKPILKTRQLALAER